MKTILEDAWDEVQNVCGIWVYETLGAEFDRLAAELDRVKYDRSVKHDMAAEQIDELTKELADSQQECDRLKEELEASDWVGKQACKAIESAIKKTARECIEAIEKQHGGLGLAFTLRQRYGLEE